MIRFIDTHSESDQTLTEKDTHISRELTYKLTVDSEANVIELTTSPGNSRQETLRITQNPKSPLGNGEEFLDFVLKSMAANKVERKLPTHLETFDEDESDYANLWDSNSGTYHTNKTIMGSLLRSKVNRQNSHDTERRRAWIMEDSDELSTPEATLGQGARVFDPNKLKSLQAKVNSMDLELTDFDHFADLKHSTSLLELSQIFKSTTGLGKFILIVYIGSTTRLPHPKGTEFSLGC